jgi:hypothetical protein
MKFKIIESFSNEALKKGKTFYFTPVKAIEIIGILKKQGIPVLGLDAVIVAPGITRPSMEHSINLSELRSEETWEQAIDFLKKMNESELLFEIIADE